jgi:hypothetical protein
MSRPFEYWNSLVFGSQNQHHKSFFFSESAKLKVQLEEKWVSALEVDEDKSEEEDKSKKEKTLPVETRPSQKEVDRAKEVIVMLEDE